MTLTGTTTPNQNGPESNGNEGLLSNPELEPHYQMHSSGFTQDLFSSRECYTSAKDAICVF